MFGFGDTDAGKIRKVNQDAIYVKNESIGYLDNLYIVADGIGGHKAGEVASITAIDLFITYIKENHEEEILDLLVSALSFSNKKVYEMSIKNEDYEGMGTTLLAATIKDNKIFIAHVGDCRLYGVRSDKIVQITSDHTYAMDLFKAGVISKEDAKKSKDSSILTRALGTDKNIKADALFCDIYKGDIFIMCSDGLTDMVSDNEIFNIVKDNSITGNIKVERLIEAANNNGGKDNIAVIIIEEQEVGYEARA